MTNGKTSKTYAAPKFRGAARADRDFRAAMDHLDRRFNKPNGGRDIRNEIRPLGLRLNLEATKANWRLLRPLDRAMMIAKNLRRIARRNQK